jgi:replicative DNA helicase
MSFTLSNTETTIRDADAERGLISAVCKNPDALAECMEAGVTDDWFAVPLHQNIWEVIRKFDVTGSTTLDLDVILAFGDEDRHSVQTVMDSNETGVQYKPFLLKVRDTWRRRKILGIGLKLQEAARSPEFETADQIVEIADRDFTAMTMEDAVTLEASREVVERTWNNLKIRQESGSVDGIPSGLSRLDSYTHGFRPGDVCVVAARTSVGKTAFSIELALGALKAKKSVLYFSLEMTNDQVMERMIANYSGIPIVQVVDKTLNDTQQLTLTESRRWLANAPLMMDDNGSITVSGIRAKARKQARKGLGMIIIDYAQLIRPEDPRVPREQQVATVSKAIKALAKELKVPIIMLAQLRRSADEANRMPRLSDLRESGSLEQDADIVMMIWRKDDDPAKTRVSIAKQRQGRCGTVEVEFKPSIQKFMPAKLLS